MSSEHNTTTETTDAAASRMSKSRQLSAAAKLRIDSFIARRRRARLHRELNHLSDTTLQDVGVFRASSRPFQSLNSDQKAAVSVHVLARGLSRLS